jgi:competence protein ComEA
MHDLDHLTALIEQALDRYQTPADIAGFLASQGVCVSGGTNTRLDINTASLVNLMAIPGISRATAGRIISRRETFGPFADLEELLLVPGVGPARLERIKAYLTL